MGSSVIKLPVKTKEINPRYDTYGPLSTTYRLTYLSLSCPPPVVGQSAGKMDCGILLVDFIRLSSSSSPDRQQPPGHDCKCSSLDPQPVNYNNCVWGFGRLSRSLSSHRHSSNCITLIKLYTRHAALTSSLALPMTPFFVSLSGTIIKLGGTFCKI